MPYKLVLGSCGVGKSALTICFLQNCFMAEYQPTGREMYHGVVVVDRHSYELDILDTLRGENCTTLPEEYIRWGDGFLCVYAVDYIRTSMDVTIFWDRVRMVKGTNPVPMVLVANKIDVAHWLVDSDMGQEAGESLKVPFVEASAKSRQGVEQVFHALIREIRQKRAEDEPKGCPGAWVDHCTIL